MTRSNETKLKGSKLKGKEKVESTDGFRCFKCNKFRHKSGDCIRRKFANITRQEEENFEKAEMTVEEGYKLLKKEIS